MFFYKKQADFFSFIIIAIIALSSCYEEAIELPDPPVTKRNFFNTVSDDSEKETVKDTYTIKHSETSDNDKIFISFSVQKNNTAFKAESDEWLIKAWYSADGTGEMDWDGIEGIALDGMFALERQEDVYSVYFNYALFEGETMHVQHEKVKIDVPALPNSEETKETENQNTNSFALNILTDTVKNGFLPKKYRDRGE